jgi:hypothetical protein
MRRELRTVSDDETWINEMLENMPEENPLYEREYYHRR